MVSVAISRFVVLTCGTLYPAYRSFKAVKTKDVREYVKWMMYWIVFALFIFAEGIADLFISFWFPFYYEAKILFVLWLLSPWTKGASILYRKWIHPALTKREKDIDALLDHAKSESYNQLVRFGSQSLVAARDIVAQAAIRGQAQIVQQLQRSVSAQDVNMEISEQRRRAKTIDIQEIVEEVDSEHEKDGRHHDEVAEEDPLSLTSQHQRHVVVLLVLALAIARVAVERRLSLQTPIQRRFPGATHVAINSRVKLCFAFRIQTCKHHSAIVKIKSF
ncbi:unnamed protein product, partial [Mesorhabditis belari]|uniref:Receptor expression-enhancing protein n=1 Tax=Mesorhabditis belari TaxID=2138241 RepID=A0AAF3EBA1_9BILA